MLSTAQEPKRKNDCWQGRGFAGSGVATRTKINWGNYINIINMKF